METRSEVRIEDRQVPAEPCVYIAAKRAVADLPAFFGEAFGKLYGYACSKTQPGAAFGRYYTWDTELIQLDAGVVTSDELEPQGEIQAGTYGGHRALYALHVGPYSDVGPVYELMREEMKRLGVGPAGPPYEVFLNSPAEVPESELKTEVYWPVA